MQITQIMIDFDHFMEKDYDLFKKPQKIFRKSIILLEKTLFSMNSGGIAILKNDEIFNYLSFQIINQNPCI